MSSTILIYNHYCHTNAALKLCTQNYIQNFCRKFEFKSLMDMKGHNFLHKNWIINGLKFEK